MVGDKLSDAALARGRYFANMFGYTNGAKSAIFVPESGRPFFKLRADYQNGFIEPLSKRMANWNAEYFDDQHWVLKPMVGCGYTEYELISLSPQTDDAFLSFVEYMIREFPY